MSRWIEHLGQHRIAANGLMVLTLIIGLWSYQNINRQFFPDFEFNAIIVTASWSGASAEDVQEAIAIPLENAVLAVSDIDSVRTSSSEGYVRLFIRVNEDVDLRDVQTLIEDAVTSVSLPDDVNEPSVRRAQRFEPIADLLVYGDKPIEELIARARTYADELTARGIAQIALTGSPDERFEILVNAENLLDLGMTLDQFGSAVSSDNQNLPAGIAGKADVSTQLRAQGLARDTRQISQLPVLTDSSTGAMIRVGDVATVVRKFTDDYQYITYEGLPAVKISLRRNPTQDTIDTAQIYLDWLKELNLPDDADIKIQPYNERWQFLESRIGLILKNGIAGMVLVLIILFVFLNTRIAVWVALGIPVSFMATFIFMNMIGITINALSLFGFMIAVGIIVDDAIVVSEDTQVLQARGLSPMEASIKSAIRMWPPVMASSLTTVAAFMPLLLLEGRLGELLIDIPYVVVCAITASLIECFLILPGHLAHNKKLHKKPSRFRAAVDHNFNRFRDNFFRPLATCAVEYRWLTAALVVVAFMLSITLVTSGRLKVNLPPNVEGTGMSVAVEFAEGTSQTRINDFLQYMVAQLKSVEQETNYHFIKSLVLNHRESNEAENASIEVELISDTQRPYTNQELVSHWRKKVEIPAGVEKISFGRSRWGLDNADLTIRLSSDDVDALKQASLELQKQYLTYQGVSDPSDDLPFGTEQWRFTLTPAARSLGLNLTTLATRLQTMLNGREIGFIQEDGEQLDIYVRLPESQANSLAMLTALPIALDNGDWVPIGSLLNLEIRRGVESLNREDGKLSIDVTASVDANIANANQILASVETDVLPELTSTYHVDAAIEGNRNDEQEVLNQMKIGVLVAMLMIYGILAWVFESWVWPLAVVIAIPFGLTGALFGHWLLGLNVSLLSLFGLFGLSGIVVNDSIVLISFYHRLRNEGMAVKEAAIEAAVQRLRAVLLTSITTVAGLTPLLFETSFDAQFLIPMAVTIVFGLLFGTVLILLLVPGMLVTIEQISDWVKKHHGKLVGRADPENQAGQS
ncbi:efflux RND transporter permease subunit [Gynuella sp.]|uniref:efflux RND transporter permease subunit n=1 Tax=Gynuella sp. TaxID=2969146 RepID=UPI003D0D585F